MEDCLVCFSFLPACLHLLFLTQVLNEVNQNLLAALIIFGLDVCCSISYFMFAFTQTAFSNENQLILILAGLLYCTVLEWVRIIVTSGSRAYLFK
jgi:hypothetical protein